MPARPENNFTPIKFSQSNGSGGGGGGSAGRGGTGAAGRRGGPSIRSARSGRGAAITGGAWTIGGAWTVSGASFAGFSSTNTAARVGGAGGFGGSTIGGAEGFGGGGGAIAGASARCATGTVFTSRRRFASASIVFCCVASRSSMWFSRRLTFASDTSETIGRMNGTANRTRPTRMAPSTRLVLRPRCPAAPADVGRVARGYTECPRRQCRIAPCRLRHDPPLRCH